MGSKAKIQSEILPIILKDRKEGQTYYEPFCGGMNVICEVDGIRIANDKNKYLIEMWKDLVNETKFPHIITKEMYNEARDAYNNRIEHSLTDGYIGWIGWMASYNGRFFDGGYSGHSVGDKKRNYIDEQIRNTMKQVDKLRGVILIHGEYWEMVPVEPSIIYCDIPYLNTKQYATSKDFNHDKFWDWCRQMKTKGHTIFISEYNAPEDFKCVWSKEVTNSLNTTKTYKPIEKLFTL